MKLGLVPIRNFGQITNNLYRSAQPLYEYEYEWLVKNIRLKRIINFRQIVTDHDTRMVNKLKLNIEVVNIPVVDHKTPSLDQVSKFMDLVKQPITTLIHCKHGHGRTSTFSVLAKVALGYTITQSMADERDRFHFQFRHPAQEKWLLRTFA